MPGILYIFALTNLVVGTGAFVLTGILQPLATSLDVSVAAAGQVMTAYALASAFLAPLFMVATGKWPRKRAILLALSVFAMGVVVSASAGSFLVLLAGRVLMGIGSVFTALAAGMAVALVPAERRGRALSLTFLGMSLSYAVGVPLGAWLGFQHGWQFPVWLVAIALIAIILLLAGSLPREIAAPGARFEGLGAAARQGPIVRVWLRTLFAYIAIFSVFAYSGPVLLALNPMSPARLSFTLVVFGAAGVAGTVMGGWAADRFGAVRSLRLQFATLATMMLLVPFTQGHYLLTLVAFVVWGMAGFGMTAPQQIILASMAPLQAPLLISLNASMLYVGTALGAIISGAFVGSIGFANLSWVGLPFALVALATLWFDSPLEIRAAIAR